MVRKTFRCVIVDPATNAQLCTGIQINVPGGLSRGEAVDFVTEAISKDVARYAAWEALGLGPFDKNTDWAEIVT
ncbi:MAG: hypothetical protein NVS3B5_01660 [Sphingomicrobium sp.]